MSKSTKPANIEPRCNAQRLVHIWSCLHSTLTYCYYTTITIFDFAEIFSLFFIVALVICRRTIKIHSPMNVFFFTSLIHSRSDHICEAAKMHMDFAAFFSTYLYVCCLSIYALKLCVFCFSSSMNLFVVRDNHNCAGPQPKPQSPRICMNALCIRKGETSTARVDMTKIKSMGEEQRKK